MKRRHFSRSFKVEVLQRIEDSGLRCNRVALDMGLDPSVVRRWKRQLDREGSDSFPGSGHVRSSAAKQRQLERENARLRQENEILKKAMAFFGKESSIGTDSSGKRR